MTHFPEPITTNMQIGILLLAFKYPVIFKQNFQINIIFIQINVIVCLLCAHHLMTSIILHSRRPKCQKMSVMHLDLCFSWFSFFEFWGAEKNVFHIVPFRPTRYVLKIFRCLEVSNRERNWNKVKKTCMWGPNFYYANSKY